jgi:hypothetical protein
MSNRGRIFTCSTCGIGYEARALEDAVTDHDLDEDHQFALDQGEVAAPASAAYLAEWAATEPFGLDFGPVSDPFE